MIMIHSWPKPPKFATCLFVLLALLICYLQVVSILKRARNHHISQIRTKVFCDKNFNIHHDQQRFLFFPMVSIVMNAGIGNQLFEVLSLLGMARSLNRTAIFNSDDWRLQKNLKEGLHSKLPRVAEQVISIPFEIEEATRYVNSPACCHYQMTPLLFCEQTKFLAVEGYYFQSFKYFSNIESSIRMWLKPSQLEIQRLESQVEKNNKLQHKICVHIRRGDFLTDGQHAGTDRIFTINSIDYLYSLKPGLIYLFSNDPKWTQSRIALFLDYQRDIRVMETPSEEALSDLYFSQIHCDSVLITAPSSTFGWWMGYLSKNMSNVYYRDIREVDDRVKYEMIEEDFFPPQWKKMKMLDGEKIVVVG